MRGPPRSRPSKWLRANGTHIGSPFVRVGAAQEAEERRLLGLGWTIKEVAANVGTQFRALERRNALLYRIDVQAAFQQRLDCEGLPVRLRTDDAFGHWFAGLFDGEGHFVMQLRRRPGRWELSLGLNIYLRDDDAGVLQRVHEGIGGTFRQTSKNNVAHWRLRGIANLAEVAVPLFDRYSLYSKKGVEFQLFRKLVLQRYIATLGGKRRSAPLDNIQDIQWAIVELSARRRYADRSSWRVLESAATYGGVSSVAA